MARTVADFLVERLMEWGVTRIYGYPGDGINGITTALRRGGHGCDFVQVRHEETAAFMASAHAKYSGTDSPGVCLATSGPGAIHLLNGLYDAKMDHQPIVAIVGQQPRTALGGSYYQEVDLTNLFKDVAGEYVQMASDPAQMRHLVDRACRIALSERTVTALIVPNDVQELSAVPRPPRKHARLRSSIDFTRPKMVPEGGDLERAAEVLNSGKRVGFRFPTEVNLIGDSKETLRALIPLLWRKEDRSWRQRIERGVKRWWEVVEARAMNPAHPVNPQRVLWELSSRLPDDAMISCDCGTATGWYARNVKMKPTMMGSLSGTLLSMGSGVPYAVAAKFCHPDRPAIALVGDGAMQMNGIAELITAAKYWERREGPRLVVLVLNNRDLSFVTWEQRATEGDPRFEASQDLPDVPYARWAEMLGLKGIRVEDPDDVAKAWDEALAADRPVVYEAIVDAEVPPMPPHISFDQAKSMTRALYRGDPAAPEIIRHSFADLIEEYIPHR